MYITPNRTMSIKFTDRGNGIGEISCKNITISVAKEHQKMCCGTSQNNAISRVLAGEHKCRIIIIVYDKEDDEGMCECIGKYDLTIDNDTGEFSFRGGNNYIDENNPEFCVNISIKCGYKTNKEDIDNLMRFILVDE